MGAKTWAQLGRIRRHCRITVIIKKLEPPLGPWSLCFSFSLADLGCLLLVHKILDDAVQVCIAPGKEQDIVSSDRCPTCMATEALQIYCDIFWFILSELVPTSIGMAG